MESQIKWSNFCSRDGWFRLQRRVLDRECEYDRVLRQERRGQDVRCSVHQKFDADETVSMR